MTVGLGDIDLVIFDKDGTLIDFAAMWRDWATDVAAALRAVTGRPIEGPLFAMFGYDPATGRILASGGLAATPMARLRDRTRDILVMAGLATSEAERALRTAWHAPDPVTLARPLTDLSVLFGGLRRSGKRIAVATSDDRDPTDRTFAALDLAGSLDATVCADDGIAVKPAPDMVLHLCATLGIAPARTAVVGDTRADLWMARTAGAGLTIGVLTGVGGREDLAPLADRILDSVAGLLPE